MKENELYGPITKGAAREGITLLKIVDGSVGLKPYDFFGHIRSCIRCDKHPPMVGENMMYRASRWAIPISVEVKVARSGLPMQPQYLELRKDVAKLFAKHQLNWLRKDTSDGGIALGVIHFENYAKTQVYSFDHELTCVNELTYSKSAGEVVGWRNVLNELYPGLLITQQV